MEIIAWYKMFRFINKVLILVLISTVNYLKCISLKNQECKLRKVIINNDYMTFPYKVGVNRCVGSCIDINNPILKSVHLTSLKISVQKFLI